MKKRRSPPEGGSMAEHLQAAQMLSKFGESPYDPRVYPAKRVMDVDRPSQAGLGTHTALGDGTKPPALKGYNVHHSRHGEDISDFLSEIDEPGLVAALAEMFKNPENFPMPSVEAFRNTLVDGVVAFNPQLQLDQSVAEGLTHLIRNTVKAGRLIDFGMVPNDMLKATATKHRLAFQHGGMVMPYDIWIAHMPWEGGTSGYFIGQVPGANVPNTILELYGVCSNRAYTILVNDMLHFRRKGDDVEFIPMPWISHTDMSRRCANVSDPLVTMLAILHDASNVIERREAPAKLNKARVKSGKPAIPSHITVIRPHAPGRPHQGGTHASPEAHWRRAHERHLASGETVHVRETRVNWREGAELHRLLYKTKV